MKRFFTIVASTLLLTSAFTASSFAGWGPNGQYGNAVPGSKPVGQSSRPSTNPASAPITTPFNPNGNLGAVPGSYKDPAMQATHSKAWQAQQYAKAKANFDKKQYSPRLAPENMSHNTGNGSVKPQYPNGIPFMPTSNHQTSGYGGNNGGFFGNDGPTRQRHTDPSYPPYNGNNNYPKTTNYPTNNYPQYPTTNNYPQRPQTQYPTTGGYGGQSTSSGWGGYGGSSTTSGYGGQAPSQYGMFAR